MNVIRKKGWTLYDTATGQPMLENTKVMVNGVVVTVEGGEPPQHAASTGRAWIRAEGSFQRTVFPNVIAAVWLSDELIEQMPKKGN